MDGTSRDGKVHFVSEVMTITPEIAERYLKHNYKGNRPVTWSRVESMASDMRDGAWEVTHQGICFDIHGDLIDGQHRLRAVILSGVTVQILVFRAVASKISYSSPLDRGLNRRVGTILGMQNRDIAAISMLRGLESGIISTALQHLTVHDAQSVFERHKELFEVLKTVPNSSRLLGPQRAALIWTLPIDQEKVLLFTAKLITGEMISKGHPAYAYRAWRERQKHSTKIEICMAMLNCLRHFIVGNDLASVYTTDIGYRAITTRRRAMRIENTPSVDLVLSVTM